MPAAALKPRRRTLEIASAPESQVDEASAFAAGDMTAPVLEAWADRRGPLRPGRLIPTRARLRGEALANGFRLAATAALPALAWIGFDIVNPIGLWMSPAGAIAPFALSVVLLL